MRLSSTVVADVTTFNFNLLFEIGFAIGLGLPVVPIRDTSYELDRKHFDELGILETLGYLDFANVEDLIHEIRPRVPANPLPAVPDKEFRESPVYVVKDHVNTEGTIQLMSTMNKSGLRYRTYDPAENPALSLSDARRQVHGSFGVVAHMLSPNRRGALAHNALCALVGGIAMAEGKVVVLLQEERIAQPIDYRDVVTSYSRPSQIPDLLALPVHLVVDRLQSSITGLGAHQPKRLLERIDLGDVAAENEVYGLQEYFVPTGQFLQARQGHARLVVGRKGTGKTAIFYDIQHSAPRGNSRLTLSLKPEGHQFQELRDVVSRRLTAGLQEHTMVAFWNYILLCELARRVLDQDKTFAQRDPRRLRAYERVERVYRGHDPGDEADFSQRLLLQVNRIAAQLEDRTVEEAGDKLTEIIYAGDIRELNEAVSEYLSEKESVWLLIDNIDKGWPLRGSTPADILIVRALLEATRKLQQQLEDREVEIRSLVFLRTDIYDHLAFEMPDKGKETAIRLDWDDPEVFREILRRRVQASTPLQGDFSSVWPQICTSHVGAQDSFNYIVERTLMRPRDLLLFIYRAIEVAINRGHQKIQEEDLTHAEKRYSDDMLLANAYEIQDTKPEYWEVPYAFQGLNDTLSRDEVIASLYGAGIVTDEEAEQVIELLLWYGFLGVKASGFPEPKYAYDVQYNMRRLVQPIEVGDGAYVIHPAFRAALDTRAT
jgi:hypothetical protein